MDTNLRDLQTAIRSIRALILELEERQLFVHQEILAAQMQRNAIEDRLLSEDGVDLENADTISAASDFSYQSDIECDIEMICLCGNCVKEVKLEED